MSLRSDLDSAIGNYGLSDNRLKWFLAKALANLVSEDWNKEFLSDNELLKLAAKFVSSISDKGPFQFFDSVLSTNQASVTIPSIPQNCAHLRLIVYGRHTSNLTAARIGMQFNGDTGPNYDFQFSEVVNNLTSFLAVYAATSFDLADWPGSSSSRSTQASAVECIIPHYTNTIFDKSFVSTGGIVVGSSGIAAGTQTVFGDWRNVAAITSLTILAPTGFSLQAGSRITLYGF